MTRAIVTEKPSVARDIARVLGADQRRDGYLEGAGLRITWALGHLVELPQPHQIHSNWKRWTRESLPMLPRQWPLRVSAKTRDQFETVKRILNSDDVTEVVCATDAGREGELIFRYIVEAAGCRKPMKRLWISSLTPDAIRAGFDSLRDADDFQPLAAAARGRSRADWLVGMNLTRAYTLAQRSAKPFRSAAGADTRSSRSRSKPGETQADVLSVGRVQTPTLAMLVERERAIRDFVPEDYLEVEATFALEGDDEATYPGTYFREVAPLADPKAAAEEDAAARAARARRLPNDGALAARLVERARRGRARVASLDARQRSLAPPLLYDLTELQRHANRLFGFSAQQTLQLAQQLYERHKLLSYPRTDSRHLSSEVASTLPRIVEAIRDPYREELADDTGTRPLGPRFVDDARVTDHHAIIPTGSRVGASRLSADEERIYTLVCVRLLAAWQADHLYSTTVVITEITPPEDLAGDPGGVDRYRSSGTRVDRQGWRSLERFLRPSPARAARATPNRAGTPAAEERDLPSQLREHAEVSVREVEALERKTRPPRAHTEASLLTAMETAGRTVDDRELSEAMRERGLGTPATRAAIIETLLQRGYVERHSKSLRATDKGMQLIEVVDEEVKSPALTGRWEFQLSQIERGQASLPTFLRDIEDFVTRVLARMSSGAPHPAATHAGTPMKRRDDGPPDDLGPPIEWLASDPPPEALAEIPPAPIPESGDLFDSPPPAPPRKQDGASLGPRTPRSDARTPSAAPAAFRRDAPQPLDRKPASPDDLPALLAECFGFDTFRPFQERVCRAVTEGSDALLVMPTGAGKSLCYQLPGIARAGTTLVLSPLIALMDDQVAALQERQLRAESIHSGKDRNHSRRVCAEYLAGALDFLFVAPERLRVRGFPEMLAKRPPSLIAVDEAHCISQWGHDFRPDYRMLREHLARLRPAPVLGLTATATPRVQRDIVEQLDLKQPKLFVHGFRRTNLAIEIVELPTNQRSAAVESVLAEPQHRPAIVYAASRKQAEELAERLARRCRAEVYHAGMTAERRQRVHTQFRAGQLEVVVATIAFGMGIDKADIRTVLHTARPRSIENYYQEIGRAGRDGAPARAVLLHSYADQRLHEWFLDRDYPSEATLSRVFSKLGAQPQGLEVLAGRTRLSPEELQPIVEKLWIHGGALVDHEDAVRRGDDGWRERYREQRALRVAEIERVRDFVDLHGCRMAAIVDHFGDTSDRQGSCGLCDMCAPEGSVLLEASPASALTASALDYVLRALRDRDGLTSGQLYNGLGGSRSRLDRRGFEEVLAAGVRAGLFHETPDAFERDGNLVHFRRVFLRGDVQSADMAAVAEYAPLARLERANPKGRSPRKRAAARGSRSGSTKAAPDAAPLSKADSDRITVLKEWRRLEAHRRKIPAFRILTDQALERVAQRDPRSEEQLLEIHGVGPSTIKKYADDLLTLLARCRAPGSA